ncbi:MAG TPA: iron-sulfur cluster assembly protein, partial [Allosphingosinicella sp.]
MVLELEEHEEIRSLDTNGVWEVLRQVPDPEIPAVSLVELGIVREATAEKVVLTPTYTGCPATYAIEMMVRAALDAAG